MNKIAGAFDTFLRVVLSVALVITFTPVSRDAAYADGADELQLGAAGSKDEGFQAQPGEEGSSTLSGSDEAAEHDESVSPEGGSSSNEVASEEQGAVGGVEPESAAPVASQASTPPGKALFRGPGSCPTAIYMSAIPRANCLNPLMKKNPPKNPSTVGPSSTYSSIGT